MARRIQSERGATLVEFIGLAVVLGVLVLAVGTRLRASGADLGIGSAERLTSLVATAPARSAPAAVSTASTWWSRPRELRASRRTAHEVRTGGGTLPARVSRDDLRVAATTPDHAWRDERVRGTGDAYGAQWRFEAGACALCTAIGWDRALEATAGSTKHRAGIAGTATVDAHASLAAVSASARVARTFGPVRGTATASGRALVGADATATARLELEHARQDLELDAGAAVGATARAEVRTGISLLGAAAQQASSVEGWAGVGARGRLAIQHERGRVSWSFGWGAALGFGGAVSTRGSIDITGVPERYRSTARRALAAAVHATLGPFGVPILLTPFGRNER
jgi:hypothetical protein